MALVIDGYNLLHVTGIFGRGVGPGTLDRARRALLNFLAESLPEKEAARTTVVFDASAPPAGAPRSVSYRSIRVLFAANYDDADALIEEVIAADSAPRQLTVVSSDHRLHRAARRRRARAVDSDKWYGQLVRRRQRRKEQSPPMSFKPDGPLTGGEVEFWLAKFGGGDVNADDWQVWSGAGPADDDSTTGAIDASRRDSREANQSLPTFNPFPPCYGDDVTG